MLAAHLQAVRLSCKLEALQFGHLLRRWSLSTLVLVISAAAAAAAVTLR